MRTGSASSITITPGNWDSEQVIQWAVQIKLPIPARQALGENEIDGSTLLTLSQSDLKHELMIKSLSTRRYLWDGIERLKMQHEVFDFQSAIDIHEEEIENLTNEEASPDHHNLDTEILTILRDDVEDQRRVINDNDIARKMQEFDDIFLQSYKDEDIAIEAQENFENLRHQEQSDHEYAMSLQNGGRRSRRQQQRDNICTETPVRSLMSLSIDSCVQNKINVAEALKEGKIALPRRRQYEEKEEESKMYSVDGNGKKEERNATSAIQDHDGISSGVKLPPISCVACGDDNIAGYELPCDHGQCRECMTKLLRAALNDSSLLPLVCCGLPIDINISRGLLPWEDCQKLFSRLAEIEAKNKMYCPHCNAFINLDYVDSSESPVFNCDCGVVLCISCRSLQHPAISCQENASRAELSKDTFFLSLAKEEKWQQCPGCSIVVELTSGCNHITCSSCRTEFCYQCASLWDTKNTKCSSGKCEVWEEENLVERANERLRVEEQAQGYAFRRGIERQQAQQVAMAALSANETCHHHWVRDDNIYVTECESCGYDMNVYGMVCQNECRSTVCYTCAYHRIGDHGWR